MMLMWMPELIENRASILPGIGTGDYLRVHHHRPPVYPKQDEILESAAFIRAFAGGRGCGKTRLAGRCQDWITSAR
jgi:hypothetical protein